MTLVGADVLDGPPRFLILICRTVSRKRNGKRKPPSGREGDRDSGGRRVREEGFYALIERTVLVDTAGSFRHTSCATSLSEGGLLPNPNSPINHNL